MKERRFKNSYRLVTEVNPRTGKPREVAEYIGEYYRFQPDGPSARQWAARALPGAALYWALAIAHLRLCRVTGNCIYALVPFMLGLLPGVYALMGLWATLRLPERMTVVQRENGPGRLVRALLGCGAFAAAGAVGCAAFLTASGQWAAGWTEPLLAAAASAAAWWGFAVSRRCVKAIVAEECVK